MLELEGSFLKTASRGQKSTLEACFSYAPSFVVL